MENLDEQEAYNWQEEENGQEEEGMEERQQGRSNSQHELEQHRASQMSKSASKSRYNQAAGENDGLGAERKAILSKIFQFYTSFGERTNLKNLRSNKFHKMMQDCGIPISKTGLDLMFVAENHHR